MEQTNITQLPYTKYKKINCLSYNCNPYHGIECEDNDSSDDDEECHHRYHNVVQKIDDLTAILDYDVIFKDHQLTFCNSMEDQILFIFEMNSRQIILFSMKQIQTIMCEHNKCSKSMMSLMRPSLVENVEKSRISMLSPSLQDASKFNIKKQKLKEKAKNMMSNIHNYLQPDEEDSQIDESGHI